MSAARDHDVADGEFVGEGTCHPGEDDRIDAAVADQGRRRDRRRDLADAGLHECDALVAETAVVEPSAHRFGDLLVGELLVEAVDLLGEGTDHPDVRVGVEHPCSVG